MNQTLLRTASLLSVLLFTSSALADPAGITVQLGLVPSNQCGVNGNELRRLDKGPDGQYTPGAGAYQVPAANWLELTDLSYEIANLTAPGLPGIISIWTVNRSTGQSLDGLHHKFAFDAQYSESNGSYRLDSKLSVKWGGTYHVNFQSGLQIASQHRVCVAVHNARFSTVGFRGRLIAPAMPLSGGRFEGALNGGVLTGELTKLQ